MGAYLEGLIFMIKYNGALQRPAIPRPIKPPVLESKAISVKYVDDGAVAVGIELKQCLIEDQQKRPRPLNYSERTCQVLPPANNLLQYYIHDAEKFTQNNGMKINKTKRNKLGLSCAKLTTA